MNEKMTKGSIPAILLKLTGPILLGQLLQQIYNIADTVIVGQFVGKAALAGIGADWAINYIVSFFCIGSCTAISVPLSQSIGAEDDRRLRKYFFNGIYGAAMLAIVLTGMTVIYSNDILHWLSTPSEVFDDAYTYLVIIMGGLVFTVIYNFCFGVLMAFGDSKKASVFMAISTVVNIVLDLVLIIIFKLGVAGAALATVIAQGMAGLASAYYVVKKYKVLFAISSRQEMAVSGKHLYNISKMCLPMGIQYSITAIGALVLQESLNSLGTDAIAAYSVGQKIKSVLLCPLSALGTALSAVAGQNYGAKEITRLKSGLKTSLVMGVLYSVLMIGVAMIFSRPLAYLFVSRQDTVICDYIQQFTIGCSIFNLLLAFLFSHRYLVQGMGYGRYALLSSLAEMLGRIVAGVWLVPRLGFIAVVLSEGLTFAAGAIVIVPICLIILHKLDS